MESIQVSDAAKWPYICMLYAGFKNDLSTLAIGTGTLISPVLILTAGHVVYDGHKGWASSVTARFRSDPATDQPAATFRTTTQWTSVDASRPDSVESAYDVGVVVLKQPVDLTLGIRPLPVETSNDSGLRAMTLSVAGYPASPPPVGTLYGASSTLSDLTPTRLHYPIATVDGMSGGPVYDFDVSSSTRTIRGVHTSLGSALRITEGILSLLLDWKKEFRP
ncbi:MAG TPA: trypsin-like peptidase domain-containing protein [Pirellulales bacterium]|nr:trypsin-like peptidase domain-containing protein [Pirellulales bacterium]